MPASKCESTSLNHAMIAIGYGMTNEVEFAIIQNSWGEDWGERGIFKIELTDDGVGPCGLYLKNYEALV
jgi:cathepsin H